MLGLFKKEDILQKIKNKDAVFRFCVYLFAVFCLSLLYNLFFVPYSLVIGGVGGLAIVVKDLTGFSTSLFNNIVTIILLLISSILIGKKKTMNSIVGAVIYPLMVTLTEPISKFISIEIESYLFLVLIVSVIYGILYGIIYRIGYTTGGTDIVLNIVSEYKKMPMGTACTYINIGIVLLGVICFGVPHVIYGVICLYLGNYITDFVLLGNRDSKMCLIKTVKYRDLEKLLENQYKVGYTILKSAGGVDKRKRTTLFCIIPTEHYYDFCHNLKLVDANAFMSSFNCYEVSGGYRSSIMPF